MHPAAQETGETDKYIDCILATKESPNVAIECMFRNLSLLSKINQYDAITGAFSGAKEAKPVTLS